MKIRALLIGAVAAAMASSAVAADGAYVGGLLGQTKFTASDVDGSESRFTWGAFAGYRFNSYIAAELGYYKPSTWTETEGVETLTLSNNTLAASLLIGAPITGALSAYARLGAARTKLKVHYDDGVDAVSVSDSSTELLYGGGLAFSFGKAGVRAEYTKVDSDFIDGDLISLGFTWSFSP